MNQKQALADRRVENIIGRLLRTGVIIAASIVAVGGASYLCQHAGAVPRYGSFKGEPAFLEHVGAVIAAAATLRSEALVQFGLLVLIAIPIVRVAISIVAFLLKRDWMYSVVTSLVLGVLLFALLGGRI